MFDTSKALKTGRTLAEKALAFARETAVLKEFEADVKRVLTPVNADADPQKARPTVGQGMSVVEITDSMPAEGAAASHTVTILVSQFGISLRAHGADKGVLLHIVDGEMVCVDIDAAGRVAEDVRAPADVTAEAGTDDAAAPTPRQPEFNMTPTKVDILQALTTDGPRALAAFHIPTVGLCEAHAWIRSKDPARAKKADMTWEITDAGRNALAWFELHKAKLR